MKKFFYREVRDISILLRTVPSSVMIFFTLSVVLMNLMANKEIYTGVDWLALDCGLLLSWLSFLCMDILTKRFGPAAAIKLSLVTVVANLFVCAVLKVVSLVPGNWGEFYSFGLDAVNDALNNTVGGTWYVLFGSTVAFIVSSVINAVMNSAIGDLLNRDDLQAYLIRSYFSTLLAQFFDNLVFSFIVSYRFFGWSPLQCVTCAITGCVVELLCEAVVSPIGYRISKKWEEEKVGQSYIDSRKECV